MSMDFADRVTVHPPVSVPRRMASCMWRQRSWSAICPQTPRLDGQIALVTGGSRGIGLETTRGLAVRGAEVVSASRDAASGTRVAEAIRAEFGVPSHFASLDLSDLSSIPRMLDHLEALLAGRRLSILVANAGLWPTRHMLSAQGHEVAFATNVLGHHALLRGALGLDLLSERVRVVVVTGDIYIMSSNCSSDYEYRGALGGQMAYCRSKLGNLWYAREVARRHPKMRVHAVHPGVIASELGGSSAGLVGAIKRAVMLSPEQGAQTSLFCATQPDLESGTYYHNVLGRVELHPDDPAADEVKSAALWDLVEHLCSQASTR
jgi:retinol dehydrogenase-12